MPSKQTPLNQLFEQDEEVEGSVKYSDGSVQTVGDRHYRVRMTFAWAALAYDMAHAIVSAVSQHPVSVTPRTRKSGDPSYISEQTFECRPQGGVPTTTPLFRRDASGQRLARVEVELVGLNTFTEIPDAITGGPDTI